MSYPKDAGAKQCSPGLGTVTAFSEPPGCQTILLNLLRASAGIQERFKTGLDEVDALPGRVAKVLRQPNLVSIAYQQTQHGGQHAAEPGSRSCNCARLRRWSNSGIACSTCQASASVPGRIMRPLVPGGG